MKNYNLSSIPAVSRLTGSSAKRRLSFLLSTLGGASLMTSSLATGNTVLTQIDFLDLNFADGLENTLNVNGQVENLEVIRDELSHVGDYSYRVNYDVDLDGDQVLDTVSFTIQVAAVTGSVADHGLIDVTTTNSASATIGTEEASLSLNQFFTTTSSMPEGATLIFSLTGLNSSVGELEFDGFTGFRYQEGTSSHGHGYVVGEGQGLIAKVWNNNGEQSLDTPETTLYVTSDHKNGNTSTPANWGVANLNLSFTVKEEELNPEVFYVKTNGNDSNDGYSVVTAFATIQHAVNQMGPGDTCYILGGRYRETVDLSNLAGTEASEGREISGPDLKIQGDYTREKCRGIKTNPADTKNYFHRKIYILLFFYKDHLRETRRHQ